MTIPDPNALVAPGQPFESLGGLQGTITALAMHEFYGGEMAPIGVHVEFEDGVKRQPWDFGQFYFTTEDGKVHQSRRRGYALHFTEWYKEVEAQARKHGVTPKQLANILLDRKAHEILEWVEFEDFTNELNKHHEQTDQNR